MTNPVFCRFLLTLPAGVIICSHEIDDTAAGGGIQSFEFGPATSGETSVYDQEVTASLDAPGFCDFEGSGEFD